MSEHSLGPPLVIRRRISRRLAGYIGLSHLLAVAAVVPLPWPWPLRLALVVVIALHAAVVVWGQLLARFRWSIRIAIWSGAGWDLVLGDGRVKEAHLLPSTYVGVHLVILRFRVGRWQRRSLVLLPDALDADLLRRLRARLRLEHDPGKRS